MLSVVMLSVILLSVVIKLILLSDVMLIVIKLNFVMLSVVATFLFTKTSITFTNATAYYKGPHTCSHLIDMPTNNKLW
jgi:hypothetical protein